MAVNRRTRVLLGVLIVLSVVAVVVWTTGGSGGAAGTAGRRTPPRAQANTPAAAADESQQTPAHVQLDALKVQRAEPAEAERDPFRFQVRAPAPPPVDVAPAKPVNESAFAPVPLVPPGPPPPPPIPLKFIGVVEQGGKRVAVLSDGKSPISGTEGAIILGQYRILKIGAESIDMVYVDGRGRQTIRLTGQ